MPDGGLLFGRIAVLSPPQGMDTAPRPKQAANDGVDQRFSLVREIDQPARARCCGDALPGPGGEARRRTAARRGLLARRLRHRPSARP